MAAATGARYRRRDLGDVVMDSVYRVGMLIGVAAFGFAAGGSALAEPPRAIQPAAADLTGVWTNAWYTHLERPRGFAGVVATPAEAEAFEAPRRAHAGEVIDARDELGQAESEFPDNGPGLARIKGGIRSAWIVDPPDGRLPLSSEGRARLKARHAADDNTDDVEARDTEERCVTASGGAPPILNTHDANLIEIVQTGDWVVLVTEKNQWVRIVPTSKAPAAAPGGLSGQSRGHWEGRTLVVETTGLRPGLTKISDDLYLSEQARVTERFTRTGPNEIAYEFEVSDPALFTRPWRAEMVFRPAEGRRFEYACHEGNYSLPSTLSAARQAEQAATAAGKAP
jgi:hypothetical protein